MNIADFKALNVKKNKFGAKRKEYNGRSYHSTGEANYAATLDLRKKAGEIKLIIPQYKLDIRVNGVHITNYIIDFKVILINDAVELHEFKGCETPEWKLKWKLTEVLLNEIEPGSKLVLIK